MPCIFLFQEIFRIYIFFSSFKKCLEFKLENKDEINSFDPVEII